MRGERAENSGYLGQGLIVKLYEENVVVSGFLAVLSDVVGGGVTRRLDSRDLLSCTGPAHLRKQLRGSSPSNLYKRFID